MEISYLSKNGQRSGYPTHNKENSLLEQIIRVCYTGQSKGFTPSYSRKALVKLMDLKFQIQYKNIIDNNVVDALSRCPTADSDEVAISECVPSWVSKLQASYDDDPRTKKLLTELSVSNDNSKGYILSDGMIRFKGRVWVDNNSVAQQHILLALHMTVGWEYILGYQPLTIGSNNNFA